MRSWPGHGLTFHFPGAHPSAATASKPSRRRRRSATQPLTLLADLIRRRVYWCIDEKYPIDGAFERFSQVAAWLPSIADPEIAGVLLCRCRGLLGDRALTGAGIAAPWGERLLERAGYHQIWIHQFLRVKVLRHVFAAFPDDIPSAKALDEMLSRLVKPAAHRLFVAEHNQAVFGESTSRGMLTQNCYFSMKSRGLPRPDFFDGRRAADHHGRRLWAESPRPVDNTGGPQAGAQAAIGRRGRRTASGWASRCSALRRNGPQVGRGVQDRRQAPMV
jgi:hypothetical protein